jgi:CheY-like chemotaxis protein
VTPATSTVLVLSEQPVVAALLGMLLDLIGYRPAFADDGERPEEALRRVRPVFVVLLDQEMEAAASDVFFARAAQHKVGLAVFGPRARSDRLAELAHERGVPWFEVPLDLESLVRAVEMAAASDWWRRRPDRRSGAPAEGTEARTERDADGRLVFVDPEGRRWSVYDRRRTVDRRGAGRPILHRFFVNEAGEEWAVPLAAARGGAGASAGEGAPSPEELQRQLERASRV